MPDREKVIKGLELLANWPDGLIFPDKEKWIKPCCERAVAMLKEQEAVKPIKTWELNNLSMAIDIYLCGNCKEKIVGIGKYCSYCGKPVLWEGR